VNTDHIFHIFQKYGIFKGNFTFSSMETMEIGVNHPTIGISQKVHSLARHAYHIMHVMSLTLTQLSHQAMQVTPHPHALANTTLH
jgi:hypothetical protein